MRAIEAKLIAGGFLFGAWLCLLVAAPASVLGIALNILSAVLAAGFLGAAWAQYRREP
jgi:hypothetical protein